MFMDFKKRWALAVAMNKRGISGMTGVIVTMLISLIVIIAVALPVTEDVVSSSTSTGTTATILGLLPLFLGLAALITITALFA